ncbi:hydrogenase-4 component E [Ruminiclostridium sufflavum DSM 19573]|uniref:Hydrogenase-4 component E n=1 Tax=Ruminiclostridium sufflavum DSM 19573 TaxID=1121337 RepID=A0A318XXL1_9FIRM|nr:hydrogenase [Ruminiclostridium sufflavum]PYG87537.1 hydrogenase-4 component E [Ruminiclostridium sufflavum DSM 19573]
MYSNAINLLAILILISSFILIANKRQNAYISTFRFQSLLLALVSLLVSVRSMLSNKKFDEVIIIFCLIVLFKVVIIPIVLKRTSKKVEYTVEKDFFINIPVSMLICCGLVVLCWHVIYSIEGINNSDTRNYLIYSMSVVMLGLFFMISRKKAIGQIVGFLVIENGMFLAAMLTTEGMPMFVELGLFFDLLTAVLIMGIFVFKINDTFDSIDINKLKNLKG